MATSEIQEKVRFSRLPVPMNHNKHVSRIPVLLPKSKTACTTEPASTTPATVVATTTTSAATATTTLTTQTSSLSSTSTTTTILTSKKSTKTVTLTLLPLPATRKHSFSNSTNKKLYGILKQPSSSSDPKISPSQHLTGIKQNVKQNCSSTVPDLIKSIPNQCENRFGMPEKQLQILRAGKTSRYANLDTYNQHLRKTAEKTLPQPLTCNLLPTFGKRDSFSDDTSSSVTSYSSACGDLSTSQADDIRWSSTSGYESDETGPLSRQQNLQKFKQSSIPLKISKTKKAHLITAPWLNLKDLNFQNTDILTESEIAALNARLERLFEVYKKIERNKLHKAAGKVKYPNSNVRMKFSLVKPKVRSYAPSYVSKPITFDKSFEKTSSAKTRQSLISKPTSMQGLISKQSSMQGLISKQSSMHYHHQQEKQLKQSRLPNHVKNTLTDHLKSLKSCFSGVDKSTSAQSPVQLHRQPNGQKIAQNKFEDPNINKNSNNESGGYDKTNIPGNKFLDGKRLAERNSKKSARQSKESSTTQICSPKTFSKNNDKLHHNSIQQCDSLKNKFQLGSPPSEPSLPPASITINKMPNFCSPRIKCRKTQSSERSSLLFSSALIKTEDPTANTEEELDRETAVRRSSSAIQNMKLPKRLSREELGQVGRSSSRSLSGYGSLGSSTLMGRPKPGTGFTVENKSGTRWKITEADSVSSIQQSDGTSNVPRNFPQKIHSCQPLTQVSCKCQSIRPTASAGFSNSNVQSVKKLVPKRIQTKHFSDDVMAKSALQCLSPRAVPDALSKPPLNPPPTLARKLYKVTAI